MATKKAKVSFGHLYALDARYKYKQLHPDCALLKIKQENISSFKKDMQKVDRMHEILDALIAESKKRRR